MRFQLLRALVMTLAAISSAGCGASGPARTASDTPAHLGSDDPHVRAKQADALRRSRAAEHRAVNRVTTPSDASTRAAPPPPRPVARAGAAAPRPTIVRRFIPYPSRRLQEMIAYSRRHYGDATYRLTDPKVIVEHFTAGGTFASTYNTFAPDRPDIELHELPGLCSHFVVDRNGTIYQLVPTSIRCRHTVGLNYTAIGIEHVGFSDQQVLSDRAQFGASVRLTRWLRCRFAIAAKDVIGHNESLSSPYHHERVARLRTQTHGDFNKASMDAYRRALRAKGDC